jgi:hypothetical protein
LPYELPSYNGFAGEVVKVGNIFHEIYYDTLHVSKDEAELFGHKLAELGILGAKSKMQLKLDKSNDTLEVFVPVKNGVWRDSAIVADFGDLYRLLNITFPRHPLILNLVSKNFDDVRMCIGRGHTSVGQ